LEDENIHELPHPRVMANSHPCNSGIDQEENIPHVFCYLNRHIEIYNKDRVMLPIQFMADNRNTVTVNAYYDGGAAVNYLTVATAKQLHAHIIKPGKQEVHQGAVGKFHIIGKAMVHITIYGLTFNIEVSIPDVSLPFKMIMGRNTMADLHLLDSPFDGCVYHHDETGKVHKWPLIRMSTTDINRSMVVQQVPEGCSSNTPLTGVTSEPSDIVQELEQMLANMYTSSSVTHESPEKFQRIEFYKWVNEIKQQLITAGADRASVKRVVRTLRSSAQNPDTQTEFCYTFSDSDINRYRKDLIEKSEFTNMWTSNQELAKLLLTFAHLFRIDHLGANVDVTHKIDTGEAKPQKSNYYRMDPVKMRVIAEKVHSLLKQGLIRRSTSPWASPVVLVNKPDGTYRFCIDFRRLNSVTKMDAHAIPRIDYLLAQLGNKKVYSTCDMASGYWQIPMDPGDIEKTAFTTFWGLYEWLVMPFGLLSATATFQRTMQQLFRDEIGQYVFAYVDDLIIYSESIEQHLFHLLQVFKKLSRAGFVLNFKKCTFMCSQVKYLGHYINEQGITPDLDKVEKINNLPTPETQAAAFSFLQSVGYYRRFIEKFSWKAKPLFKCKPKSKHALTAEQIEATKVLKTELAKCFQLNSYDPSRPCIVVTDAAMLNGVAAVLLQMDESGNEVPIEFASKHCPMGDLKNQYQAECKGIVFALRKFRPYIIGNQFILRTDCNALATAWRSTPETRHHANWLVELQEYNFKTEHIKGIFNTPVEPQYAPWEVCDVHEITKNYIRAKTKDAARCEKEYMEYAKKYLNHKEVTPDKLLAHMTNVSTLLLTLSDDIWVKFCLPSRPSKIRQKTYEVSFIVDDRFTDKLEYLCRWKGYTKKDDSWEPIENFVSHQAINEYLDRKHCSDPMLIKLQHAQKDDKKLGIIYDALSNSRPIETNLTMNMRSLLLGQTEDGKFKPIVPKPFMYEMVKDFHLTSLQVHPSIEQMSKTMSDKFICENIHSIAREVKRSCHTCAKFGQNLPKAVASTQLNSSAPFEIIEMDFIGPLPETAMGNKLILLVVDQYTKWPEAIPLREKSAEIVAKALIHLVISRHGTPDIIIHDSDSTFMAQTIQAIMSELGIRSLPTLPYNPRPHGLVERTIRSLRDKLSRLCDVYKSDWDTCLDVAMYALRTQYKQVIKSTPFNKLYQRRHQDPSDNSTLTSKLSRLFNKQLEEFRLNRPTTAVLKKRKLLASLPKAALFDQVFKQITAPNMVIKIGDVCIARDMNPRSTAEAKFKPRWLGPYIVTSTSRNTVRLLDRHTGAEMDRHKNDVKLYKMDLLQ
jgi:hypothetical protein